MLPVECNHRRTASMTGSTGSTRSRLSHLLTSSLDIGNESVGLPDYRLAQCWFPGLASSKY